MSINHLIYNLINRGDIKYNVSEEKQKTKKINHHNMQFQSTEMACEMNR